MTSSSPALHRRQRTRPNIDTSSFDLPDEIIELILSKCPVKSAVRFKSVSKSWLSIISHPRFSRILQSKLSENRNKFLVWKRPSYKNRCALYFISLEDAKFQRESVFREPSGRPMCSCDGLILLKANDDEYMLWNPLIRKRIIVPAFKPDNMDAFTCHCNLYHDSMTDDYRIVLFCDECHAIYSCRNGSWGEMKDYPRDWNIEMTERSVSIDGCLYLREDYEIICFDSRDGKLHKFRQPKGVESLTRVNLKALCGRLCLYGSSDNREMNSFPYWVMEENGSLEKSWNKLVSMEKKEPYVSNLMPLYVTRDDDVVLLAVMEREYPSKIYYTYFRFNSRPNCSFQEIECHSSLKFLIYDYRLYHFPYSESLYRPSSNTC